MEKKAILFRILERYRAEKDIYVPIDKIREKLTLCQQEIGPALLREYLSEAMKAGVIYDAGKGWYSSLSENAALDKTVVSKLDGTLGKRFPFMPFYVWSTQQFNPWMHHLLGKSVSFVYVDREDVDDVSLFLRQEGWDVTVNPTQKTAKEMLVTEKAVVVKGIGREIVAEIEPRVSTALVDLLIENRKLDLMDEAERQEMVCNLLLSGRVDMGHLMARLQDHKLNFTDLAGSRAEPIIAEK